MLLLGMVVVVKAGITIHDIARLNAIAGNLLQIRQSDTVILTPLRNIEDNSFADQFFQRKVGSIQSVSKMMVRELDMGANMGAEMDLRKDVPMIILAFLLSELFPLLGKTGVDFQAVFLLARNDGMRQINNPICLHNISFR